MVTKHVNLPQGGRSAEQIQSRNKTASATYDQKFVDSRPSNLYELVGYPILNLVLPQRKKYPRVKKIVSWSRETLVKNNLLGVSGKNVNDIGGLWEECPS